MSKISDDLAEMNSCTECCKTPADNIGKCSEKCTQDFLDEMFDEQYLWHRITFMIRKD